MHVWRKNITKYILWTQKAEYRPDVPWRFQFLLGFMQTQLADPQGCDAFAKLCYLRMHQSTSFFIVIISRWWSGCSCQLHMKYLQQISLDQCDVMDGYSDQGHNFAWFVPYELWRALFIWQNKNLLKMTTLTTDWLSGSVSVFIRWKNQVPLK